MKKNSKKIEKSEHFFPTSLGTIHYHLIRSNGRRTSVISIDHQGQVRIYVPFLTTKDFIESFIQQKASWILKCVDKVRKNQSNISRKKFDEGGEFLFLGKKFPLCVFEQDKKRPVVKFDGSKWTVSLPREIEPAHREQTVKEKLFEWYRQQAEEVVGGRIFHFSRIIGVSPKIIAVRSQKRMWGCCHFRKQRIHINWQIILAPLKVIDYVIIHELCHLVHPNHSQRFWNKVEKYMPDYKDYKKWLKINQAELVLS
ncbi:MAG: M48 family metallopeptidase [Candidatus Omnitrophica bacterium]|nr:M48 family metallopeptidase [Candidatus Omnitrophota bacterium]